MEEIEIYHIEPKYKKCYELVVITRREGTYPYQRYFTTRPPKYLGLYIGKTPSMDGPTIASFIDEDNNTIRNDAEYGLGANAFLREIPCRQQGGGKSKRRRTRNLKKRTKTKRRNLKRK
jgi:hypothetical protein